MKPGMQWPIGIVSILTASVVGNLIMMRIANTDPAFSVESDYYERAVAFDSTLNAERLSSTLGWSAMANITNVRAGTGTVELELRGADGLNLVPDSLRVVAFFNARANDRTTRVIKGTDRDSSGVFRTSIPVVHLGQWELRIDAWRGSDHFGAVKRVEAVADAGTVPLAADGGPVRR